MALPTPLDDARAARTLLAALFGTKPDDAYVVVGQLVPVVGKPRPEVRTASFQDLGAAAAFAAGKADVYLHVGLTRRAFTGGSRPNVAEISGLGGLWADVDILDPAAHKKGNLPPDRDAALAVVRAMALPPGLVVHSGHGLQVWWPFRETWAFDDDAEHRRARILARAWAITLRERARALGYTVDVVSDLARLMRLPGTRNAKVADAVVPVEILEATDARVEPSDAEAVLLDGTWEQAEREVDGRPAAGDQVVYGDLVLDPKAEPPFDKFYALLEFEPKFRQSWDRRRKDLDGSPSAYDMSLAMYAVQAGWPDQEVASLLIAARRRHGDDLKLRPDYYGLTIGKARQRFAAESETAKLLDALEELPPPDPVTSPTDEEAGDGNEGRLAIVSDLLKVKITRFVQFTASPPQYRLETEHGAVTLGEAGAVLSLPKFRAAVFATTQRVIPRFKDKEWDRVVQALGEAVVVESIGEEATEAGIARAWVNAYVAKHPVIDDPGEASTGNFAFRHKGGVWIWADRFQQYLATSYFDRVNDRERWSALRIFGATPGKVNAYVVKDGKQRRINRNAWRLPDDWQGGGEEERPASPLQDDQEGNPP